MAEMLRGQVLLLRRDPPIYAHSLRERIERWPSPPRRDAIRLTGPATVRPGAGPDILKAALAYAGGDLRRP